MTAKQTNINKGYVNNGDIIKLLIIIKYSRIMTEIFQHMLAYM